MKISLHKRILALVLAIAIVLSTGILDSAGWLLATDGGSEDTTVTETQENTTEAPSQGATETQNITVAPSETVTEPAASDDTTSGDTTSGGDAASESSEVTEPSSSETSEATEPSSSETTQATEPSSSETTQATEPSSEPTEPLSYKAAVVVSYTVDGVYESDSTVEADFGTGNSYTHNLGKLSREGYTLEVLTAGTVAVNGQGEYTVAFSGAAEDGSSVFAITVAYTTVVTEKTATYTFTQTILYEDNPEEPQYAAAGTLTFGESDAELTFTFTPAYVEGYVVEVVGFDANGDGSFSSVYGNPGEDTQESIDVIYRLAGGAPETPENYDVTQEVPWLAVYNFYLDGAVVSSQALQAGETPVAPAAPGKDGYKFLGWFDEAGQLFSAAAVGELTANVTLSYTALFEEVRYVYFYDNQGRIVAQKEGKPGDTVAADVTFDVAADSGITGWYTDSGLTSQVTSVTLPTDSTAPIYLWAKVETGNWLVFDSQGGTYIEPVFYLPGQPTAEPAAPTKPGYTFQGWDYTFGGELTESITLTAQWSANRNTQYTVIHWLENANDSEYSFQEAETKTGTTDDTTNASAKSTSNSRTAYYGFTAQAITQQTIAGDGSTIVNVYYKRGVSEITFYVITCTNTSRNHSHRSSCWTLDSSKTISAKNGADIMAQWPLVNGSSRWAEEQGGNSYQNNIDVMPVGGDTFWEPKDNDDHLREVEYYVTVLPGETPEVTRGNLGFKIHHVDRSYGSSTSTVGDEDRYPINGFTLNTTYSTDEGDNYSRAQFFYDRNSYNLVFINGGKTDKTVSLLFEQSLDGQDYIPSRPTGVPAEYIFAGWYANQLLQGDAYSFEGKTMPAQNVTLYAKWAAPTVNGVAHLTMSGTGGTQSFDVAYGQKIDQSLLPSQESVMPQDGREYKWLGWAQRVNGILVPFNFETVIYGDITLYPYYTSADALVVAYDANGGTGTAPTDSRTYALGTYADVLSATGLTAADEDHVFLGWNTAADGTGTHYYPGDKVEILDNVVLYATWGPKDTKTSLTYDANGGLGGTTVSLDNNSIHTVLTDGEAGVSRPGYRFLGWSLTSGAGNTVKYALGADVFVFNGMVNNVLYAVWEKAEFDVTYSYSGQVPEGAPAVPGTATVVLGESYTVAANPTLPGYIFSGWSTASGGAAGATAGSTFQMPANDVAFTGSWTARQDYNYTVRHIWGTQVLATESRENLAFGAAYSAAPRTDLAGYTPHQGQSAQSGTLNDDNDGLVIEYYYYQNVELTAASGSAVYTGQPQSVSGYTGSDVTFPGLTQAAVTGSGTDAGEYAVAFPAGTVGTATEDGLYIITAARDGKLTINPRPVTLTSVSLSQQFNGSALTNGGNAVAVGGDGFVDGHGAEYSFTGSQLYPGSSANAFTYTLTGGAKAGNYAITKYEGTLTVTNRDAKYQITVKALDQTKVYDAIALNAADADQLFETLSFTFDGITYTVSGLTVSGSRTDVGETPITVSGAAVVTDPSGSVVTGQFEVATQGAVLTVTARPVTITSADLEKSYDGTALVNGETPLSITATGRGVGFVAGQGVTASFTGSQTPVGSSQNSYTLTANPGTDLNNYQITQNYGTLTVEPVGSILVTITGRSASGVYTGAEQTASGYDVSITLNGEATTLFTAADFAYSGDTVLTQTNVGSYTLELKEELFTVADTTTFPNVEFVVARDITLTISKAQLTISSPSDSKVYDGTALTNHSISASGFQGSDGATYTVTGTQTDVGSSTNSFTINWNEGTDPDNYTLVKTEGQLTVTANEEQIIVYIAGNTGSKDYDGTALEVSGWSVTGITGGNGLFTAAQVSYSGTGDSASQTSVGKAYMTMTGEEFSWNNPNFTNVTFVVENGWAQVDPITAVVTVVGNSTTATYDGTDHTASGYELTFSTDLLTAGDITFTGTAAAARTDVGTTAMGLTAEQFTVNNPNFTNVTFRVTDGFVKINPVTEEVVVTIVGNNTTATYDGTEHTASGYAVTISNSLYTTADFTFTGTAYAARTDVGTTTMGLTEGSFSNDNGNFTNVTFKVTDGFVKINPVTEEVVVTILGNKQSFVYDGQPHTVTGYQVTGISSSLYTTADFSFTGTATVTRTDVGTSGMGLTADNFANTNANFTNVTFKVTDGKVIITPVTAEVVVTIVGNKGSYVYDGTQHTVEGYQVTNISSSLYTVSDFTFTGTASASQTDVGTAYMGLTEAMFANQSSNFSKVRFEVTDGYVEITPVTEEVVVTIVGNHGTYVYDGSEHTVEGYEVTNIDNSLYTVSDFSFSGNATVSRTQQGTSQMGMTGADFINNNANFTNVTFQVTDGFVTITPDQEQVVVTIVGNKNSFVYDGQPHTVTGYVVTAISNPLFKESSIAFTGTASASRTIPGRTVMNISAANFSSTDANFANVVFEVTDGYVDITPVTEEVVVTITGSKGTYVYNGQPHTVTGYAVTNISNALYTASDFSFSGTASATQTDVGTAYMGLTEAMFTNDNGFFTNVRFVVEDGSVTVTPVTDEVVVTIEGNKDSFTYDGQPHTVTGYVVSAISNGLYTASDFSFSGTASATQTDVGTAYMGLTEAMFANTNGNFSNVSFQITDGSVTVTPVTDEVVVTIVGNSGSFTYDGQPHTVTGYQVTGISNSLYKAADFTFTGDASATQTDVGTAYMGLTEAMFANTNGNFSNVRFAITDGHVEVTPVQQAVTVTITADSYSGVYDGNQHSISGYTVTAISDPLYTAADFSFIGDANALTLAARNVTSLTMALTGADFRNDNANFASVRFVVTGGTLEITPKAVTLLSGSDEKVFDNSALVCHQIQGMEDFADSDRSSITVTYTGSQTLVGSSANTYSLSFTGDALRSNYVITENTGTLTVTDDGVPTEEVLDKAHGAAADGLYELGDVIEFTIWVRNIYDETVNLEVAEQADTTILSTLPQTLEPGQEISITAQHTVTEADLAAQEYTNTVSVSLDTNLYTDTDVVPEPELDDVTYTLEVVKTGPATALIGQTIEYTITVENTGNQTMNGITLTDPLTGGSWTVDLAPGETSQAYTTSYTVTAQDYLNGSVVNTAQAAYTYENGQAEASDTVTTAVASVLTVSAKLNDVDHTYDGTAVTASGIAGGSYTLDGSTVTFTGDSFTIDGVTFTVVPDANAFVTRTDVGEPVDDNLFVVYRYESANTQVTVNGQAVAAIGNVPTAAGTLTMRPRPVTVTTGSASKDWDGTALTSQDASAQGFVAGEGLVYLEYASIDVVGTQENWVTYQADAATKLSNYVITENFGILEITQGARFPISVQGLSGTFLYDGTTHVVEGFQNITSTDAGVAGTGAAYSQDAGSYVLSFTLNGEPFTITGLNARREARDFDFAAEAALADLPQLAAGSAYVEIQGIPAIYNANGANVTAQFDLTLIPGTITITQRQITITSGDYTQVYDGTVTGGAAPTALTNPVAQAQAVGTQDAPLPSQADTTLTFTGDGFADGEGLSFVFTGSQSAIGSSDNSFQIAGAIGTLRDTNYILTLVPGTLTVTPPEDLDIMDKTVVSTPENGLYTVGETVRFQITVTNPFEKETATVTLTEAEGFTLVNEAGETLGTAATLELAGMDTLILFAERQVTEADLIAGQVTNTISMSFAVTYDGQPYEKEETDTATTTDLEEPAPHITLAKAVVSTPAEGDRYDLGETVEYTVTVTNDGNLTLTNVEVTDMLYPHGDDSLVQQVLQQEGFDGTLAPGASIVFTYTYTVTQEDLGGSIRNVATVTADNPTTGTDDEVPTDEDETDNTVEVPTADVLHQVTVDKRLAQALAEYDIGTTVNYIIEITNTGNVTEENLFLVDQMINAFGFFTFNGLPEGCQLVDGGVAIAALEPNATLVITGSYLIDEADEGRVIGNMAILTGDTIPEPVTDLAEDVQIQHLYDLMIHYLDAEDWTVTLAPSYFQRFATGTNYSITSPEVEGYTVRTAVVAGAMPAGNTVVYVLYDRIQPDAPNPAAQNEPEPTYQLTPLEDEQTPLADVDLGDHTCCIFHFLVMLVAMVLLAFYMNDRKKYQQRIFELKETLSKEDPNWNPDEDLKA